MKAIVQDRYGSPDTLELREVDKPVPADNEVLVKVHAASVNAYDWHFMRGEPRLARLAMGFSGPKLKIRGRDLAGTVEAVGADVTRLQPGDEVYGEADGAFAEYVCVPDNAVDTKPANLTFEHAATIPLAANTALIGLRDLGQVRAGQHVLINGASGGVGIFAIQIAISLGAEITGVCSTKNVDLIKEAGANHIIDYTTEDFARSGKHYDLVLDLVGNRSLTDLRRVLTPTGTLVLSGGGVPGDGGLLGPIGLILKGTMLSRFVKHRILILRASPSKENLAALRELAESGKLAPIVERTYPLPEAPDAIRHVETAHARSKVVITV